MNGKCRELTSCCMFEGQMRDGLKHGKGIYENKKKWEGTFVNGSMEGKGKLTEYVRGIEKVTEGFWGDNYLEGFATVTMPT